MRNHSIWAIAVCAMILIPIWSTAAFFYFSPKDFFYRPWEYLMLVGRKSGYFELNWNRPRTGDLSRNYYQLRNKPWTVNMTMDRYGYRSVPEPSDLPAVLFLGDSYLAGSGISDSDTLPWVFSKKVDLPVFNAAPIERRIGALLADPQMRCVQLVVDTCGERGIQLLHPFGSGRMKRWGRRPNPFWIFKINTNYYALPALMRQYIRRRKNDWHAIKNGYSAEIKAPQTTFVGGTIAAQERAVSSIIGRHDGTRAAGRNYVFLSLPEAGSVRVTQKWAAAETSVRRSGRPDQMVDYVRRNSVRRVAKVLAGKNIWSLDLLSPFRRSYWNGRETHFAHDTHWNAHGIRITNDLLVKLVKSKSLVSRAQYEKCRSAGSR